MKQPTMYDLYESDYFMTTGGVQGALLESADVANPKYKFENNNDGKESVFYETDLGIQYYIGTRDAPMQEVQVAAGPSPVASDAGAAFGMYPKAMPKRKGAGGLEVDMNPFARVVSKGANWLADQIDKGASLYDTMQMIIPGGFDPETKVSIPTSFKPQTGRIDPATGQQLPATMGTNPVEITLGELLKATPVSEVIGLRGVGRIAESLGTGNIPDIWDVLDAAGLFPAGTGTAGVAQAVAGTAKSAAKSLAPKAAEMIMDVTEKTGMPVRGLGVTEPAPRMVISDFTETTFKAKTADEGAATRFKNPLTLKDGSRLSGFTNPKKQNVFFGYDKNGELFTIGREYVNPEDIVSSKDTNKTADRVKQGLEYLGEYKAKMSTSQQEPK